MEAEKEDTNHFTVLQNCEINQYILLKQKEAQIKIAKTAKKKKKNYKIMLYIYFFFLNYYYFF